MTAPHLPPRLSLYLTPRLSWYLPLDTPQPTDYKQQRPIFTAPAARKQFADCEPLGDPWRTIHR